LTKIDRPEEEKEIIRSLLGTIIGLLFTLQATVKIYQGDQDPDRFLLVQKPSHEGE
jgi:hypothetical protein